MLKSKSETSMSGWAFLGALAVLAAQLLLASPALADSFQLKLGKWFAQGRVLEAEEALTGRLEKNPGDTDLWLELADLRKSQYDYGGAVEAYQRCLALNNDWKVRAQMALALEQMGRFEDAEKEFLPLVQAHPDDPDVLWGMARLRLCQFKWKSIRKQFTPQEALGLAKKYLQKLVAAKPEFALATWELAEVSRALGDDDLALKSYERAARLDGSFKLAHRAIAELLAAKGKYREALVKYDQAMAIEPDDKRLKAEARRVAKAAPEEAQKRRDERLEQWEKWKAPEEKTIAPSPVTVRVGLFTVINRLLLRGGSPLLVMTPAQTPVTTLAAGVDYHVVYESAKNSATHQEIWVLRDSHGRKVASFTERLWIVPQDPQRAIVLHAVPSNTGYFFAREEDRAYRGLVEISPRPGRGFQVVNRVTLEDYLAGVLPSEMPYDWPLEALKAQAIVARTYALSKMGRHNEEGFDLCDSVHCEVYRGLRAEHERSNEAVRQTAGLILKHGRKVMPVAYSAQCGGHTQDYAEAWGYKSPVVGVEDYDPRYNQDISFPLSPLSAEKWIKENRVANCRAGGLKGYQNFRWATLVKADFLQKKLAGFGRLRRLIVTHRSTAGWADRLLVEGEQGSKEFKGDYIRSFLGGIRSNLIWIEPQFNLKGWPEEFIIYGGGWGHGVGMCQVGTYSLARGGKTCGEILEHYFPKGDVKSLDSPKAK